VEIGAYALEKEIETWFRKPKFEVRNMNNYNSRRNRIHNTVNDKNPQYSRFKPEMYNPPMSIFWWIHKKAYVKFILRELTSIFVAAYALILIFQVYAIGQGEDAWLVLIDWFSSPLSVILHIVILVFVLFHTITWFNLAPSAIVLKIGKKRIPGSVIILGNYLMWIILSAGIAWLIVRV